MRVLENDNVNLWVTILLFFSILIVVFFIISRRINSRSVVEPKVWFFIYEAVVVPPVFYFSFPWLFSLLSSIGVSMPFSLVGAVLGVVNIIFLLIVPLICNLTYERRMIVPIRIHMVTVVVELLFLVFVIHIFLRNIYSFLVMIESGQLLKFYISTCILLSVTFVFLVLVVINVAVILNRGVK